MPPFHRSVRFRIAAWNALAVATIALVALIGVRQAVRWTLLHEIDQVLREDAKEVGLALSDASPDGFVAVTDALGRKAIGHQQHQWFVAFVDANKNPIWTSRDSEAHDLPLDALVGAGPHTVDDVRVLRAAAPANPYGVQQTYVGASLAPLRSDMGGIDRAVAATGLLILLASPLCGYWMAGLATRNLETLTETAARLRPTHLDERLPIRGAEDEFDRLAATINGLLDRIAEYVAEKQSFVADAAHELRTPIAAIRSSVEVALAGERSTQDYRSLLEEVIEESASLEVLVNQVLLLSEAVVSHDQPIVESTALGEVVEKAVDMFRGVAESRGVCLTLAVQDNPLVVGVKPHLRQVVNNLIDNAIKYTGEGGSVQIDLSVDPTRGLAELVVADNGLGIGPADLPRVFDRFFRADRARQRDQTHGAGLGLSICKTIVEAHHGAIRCDSRPGEGARFTVTLPLKKEA
ncbi:Sensor kinase CusS [Pirellulimonas nuda]|uniref:histidine kinase n=1 Tax=Pirellulimonas nuda TaxID=2528009 RepID=A0A518DFN7_9BACT|nr:ATP-binding protein [Pirellulimonas nuda]QDU90252.1 Sensor kinase CusS [Pirellulimonas nuda]